MPNLRRQLLSAALVFSFASGARGDEPLTRAEIAKLGIPGTALVESKDRRGDGTAFCIHPSGLFVTSERVARGAVSLVLSAGTKEEKSHKVTVLRSDKQRDLALLRIDGVQKLPALRLGSDEALTELDDVVVIGFPFGKELATDAKTNPAVSANAGSISSLRRRAGALEQIQLAAAVNPGNTGGPVLDKHGKVIGVIVGGVRDSGGNFAVPVSTLARFVGRPEVEFEPPTLTPANVLKPTPFEARIAPVVPPDAPLSVELMVEQPGGPKRSYQMEGQGEKYRATVAPVAPQGPLKVRLSAKFVDGQINGTTTDRAIKVGNRAVQISELHSVRLGPNPQVALVDGKTVEGAVSGLTGVPIQLGGQTLQIDLDRAVTVRFSPAVEPDRIEYTLIIRQGKTELHRQSGSLLGRGFLPATGDGPRGLAITPPPLEGDKAVRKLTAPVTDVAVAGGGRYLILGLPREQKLAVFDVCAAEIIGHIPLRDPAARFTAGLEHVIVVLPGTGKVERWDLQTLERVASAPLPVAGEVKAVVMGAASRGPLLVHWAKGTAPLDETPFTLVDSNTLAVIEPSVKAPTLGGVGRYRDKFHVRASADGKSFGVWRTGTAGGFGIIVVNGTSTESLYTHEDVGHVIPGPDGKTVFTGAGKQAPRAQSTGALPRGDREVPACQGDYYLTLPPDREGGSVSIGVVGRVRPIATLTDIDAPAPDKPSIDHDFTADKRIYLIPDARLIIVIPPMNDRLVLHRYGG